MGRQAKPIGTTYINPDGVKYIKVACTGVWRIDWRTEGRVKVEAKLKRALKPTEKVIKKNGLKHDFNLENLRVIDSESDIAISFGKLGNILTYSSFEWSMFDKQCKSCQRQDKPHAALGLCTTCYSRHIRQSAH